MSKRSGPASQAKRATGPVLARVMAFCPQAFVALDAAGIVIEWNPQAEALFGWRRDEVVGQRAEETVFPGGLGGPMGTFAAEAPDQAPITPSCTFELLSGSGKTMVADATIFRLGSGKEGRGGGIGAFLGQPAEALTRLPASLPPSQSSSEPWPATAAPPEPPPGDALTGLATREQFEDHLARAIAHQASAGTVAVVLLDLDRFKAINNAWGHATGDAALILVAARLRRISGDAELLGRLSGDGILALFVDPAGEAHRLALAFGERARGALAEPLDLGGTEVFVEATVGVALNTFGAGDAPTLLANAEAAMYEAKAKGGSGVELFGEGIRLRAVDRMRTENAPHRALDRAGLGWQYKPV